MQRVDDPWRRLSGDNALSHKITNMTTGESARTTHQMIFLYEESGVCTCLHGNEWSGVEVSDGRYGPSEEHPGRVVGALVGNRDPHCMREEHTKWARKELDDMVKAKNAGGDEFRFETRTRI